MENSAMISTKHTYVFAAVVAALLPTAGVAADNGPVFQGENPILFKDLTNPEAHGYKPDKYIESYRILYGDQADEKIAAMKARRLMLLGKKPQHETRDFTKVPPHLKGYEEPVPRNSHIPLG